MVGLNLPDGGETLPSEAGVVAAEDPREDPQALEKEQLKKKMQEELVSLLRLGLVRNLSRALMEESG